MHKNTTLRYLVHPQPLRPALVVLLKEIFHTKETAWLIYGLDVAALEKNMGPREAGFEGPECLAGSLRKACWRRRSARNHFEGVAMPTGSAVTTSHSLSASKRWQDTTEQQKHSNVVQKLILDGSIMKTSEYISRAIVC